MALSTKLRNDKIRLFAFILLHFTQLYGKMQAVRHAARKEKG